MPYRRSRKRKFRLQIKRSDVVLTLFVAGMIALCVYFSRLNAPAGSREFKAGKNVSNPAASRH